MYDLFADILMFLGIHEIVEYMGQTLSTYPHQ